MPSRRFVVGLCFLHIASYAWHSGDARLLGRGLAIHSGWVRYGVEADSMCVAHAESPLGGNLLNDSGQTVSHATYKPRDYLTVMRGETTIPANPQPVCRPWKTSPCCPIPSQMRPPCPLPNLIFASRWLQLPLYPGV